jgi:hypothetical protein
MDTFPYESWEEATKAAIDSGAGYFTFGPGGNTATIVMVVLGFLVMMATIVGGIVLEDRRLVAHAARLKAGGDNGVR